MSLFWMLNSIFAFSAVFMAALIWAFRSPVGSRFRIQASKHASIPLMKLMKAVASNMTLSAALVYGYTYGLYDHLVREGAASLLGVLLESVGILLLYDVLYYVMHRYPFHEWGVLRKVHAVHHTARFPSAIHSLYMHPVEMAAGLSLLMFCTFVVGPVHIYSFGIAFFVYSYLNIVIHSGLSLPFFPFRAASYLARKHEKHHRSMKGGNYASITPICDILFGTAE